MGILAEKLLDQGNTEGKMGNATVGQVLGKMGKCWGRRRVKRNP